MHHFSLLWRSIETHVLCVSIDNSLKKKSPQIPPDTQFSWFFKELKEQNGKKNWATSYRTGVSAKQIRTWHVQRLTRLR